MKSLTTKSDAPNYRIAAGRRSCENCRFEESGHCSLYGFRFDAGATCDAHLPVVSKAGVYEVSPPGYSGTTKAMKDRHSDEIDNPWALAWWMYKQGKKPRIKPEKSPKGVKHYVSPTKYTRRKEG